MDKNFDALIMQAERMLKEVFGYESFRPMQKEVVLSILNDKDTVAIMPTGGGKSICFQLPALLFEGITLVISPLISLMEDQVSSLSENGVNAVFLNSSLEWNDYKSIVQRLKFGEIKIVYLSPEGLAAPKMKEILQDCSLPVSCITVDEAHCVSEWGHDFRPDYLSIADIRQFFPNAPCLALTATATEQVRLDIIKNLKMKNPVVFTAGFNRSNIFLEVRPKKNAVNQVVEFLREHKDESGIIYCFSRRQVDMLTASLDEIGFSVTNYHAGLSDRERSEHQKLFIRDEVSVMIATVAFGMGIDKPNVRFVIHYDLPKSLEEYYQEIGRAGRDGLSSNALLLYSSADTHKIRSFFDTSADAVRAENLLQEMLRYASSKTCRRKALLNYFGEKFTPSEKNCDCCDICSTGHLALTDVTIQVQKFMCCIIRTGQRFGTSYIIDVLLGSKMKRIIENGHNKVSTWGIGKELSKEDWFELAENMINEGLIIRRGEYNVLYITTIGKELLKTRSIVKLPIELNFYKVLNQRKSEKFILHKKNAVIRVFNDNEQKLYATLKEWRKKIADDENVPPYIIFGDKTLEELVQKKPQNEKELLNVFGIGAIKAEKIGSAIIRIIKESL